MSTSNSFKRRLLRAAVKDNLNVMQETWPHLLPSDRSRRPPWFSRGVVLLVACALFPLSYAAIMVPENRQATAGFSSAPNGGQGILSGLSVSHDSARSTIFPNGVRRNDETSFALLRTHQLIDPETLVSVPQPMDLRALALPVRTIVIDPGHGGEDPGAVTAHGLTEKELALDIGLRLRDLFVASSFDVRLTREKDQTVPLEQRVALANAAGGDLFVSIHLNWVEPRRARVVETYYLGPTGDSAALQLAGVENAHSGYSLTDFRYLLEKVYSDVKRSESRRFAESVQAQLVHALQPLSSTLTNKAVKTAPFVVLVGASMPAILVEVACLSNVEDVQLLADPAHRQRIAQALFAGVHTYTTMQYHANATRKDVSS